VEEVNAAALIGLFLSEYGNTISVNSFMLVGMKADNQNEDPWSTLGLHAERVLTKAEDAKRGFPYAVPINDKTDEIRGDAGADRNAPEERHGEAKRYAVHKLR